MSTTRGYGWATVLLTVLLAVVLNSCKGRDRVTVQATSSGASSGEELVVFDLSSGHPETTSQGGFFPRPVESTYSGLIEALRAARSDKAPRGFLLRFGSSGFNWAHAEELGRMFAKIRETGRPVTCHADVLGNAALWLAATSCDEIWLSPAGGVDSVGIAGQALYLKGLLERFKVKADFLHMGRYKSAAETFTREGPSEASIESMSAVLGSIRSAWVTGIAEARKDPQAKGAIENGPWSPKEAVAIGLVDAVGYESEARQQLKKATSGGKFVSREGAERRRQAGREVAELLRSLTGASGHSEPHIAILPAEGGIAMEPSSGLSEGGISASAFIKVVRRLKKNDAVKAVVLRIDSPGGSALASDLMWHELMELRRTKPLIASVGNMAASGGYYLACAADKVVAERTSIVGSIGVVGGKLVFADALAEYGVTAHTFSARPGDPAAANRAAYLSVFTEWDEATRTKVQHQMEDIYELFLDRVAESRAVDKEAVRAVAEGRIWSGAQGKENGLVDELGGIERALELARAQGHLEDDIDVVIEGGAESLLELLGISDEADEDEIGVAWQRLQAKRPAWFQGLTHVQRQQVMSFAPLLKGERVLTALPFVVEAK